MGRCKSWGLKMWLARVDGKVELRTEQPKDTELWLGPYTLEEIWVALAPAGNPLNRPEINAKAHEHAGSHGLKPCHFHATYDVEAKCMILFDFAGYVGTVSTPASLWKALLYQANHGPGSLRALTRVPELSNSVYRSPEEQEAINKEIVLFQLRKQQQEDEKKSTKQIGRFKTPLDLGDLDL